MVVGYCAFSMTCHRRLAHAEHHLFLRVRHGTRAHWHAHAVRMSMYLRCIMPWPAAGFAPPSRPRREQLFARNCALVVSTETPARSNCAGEGSRWTQLVAPLALSVCEHMVPSGRNYCEAVLADGEGPACICCQHYCRQSRVVCKVVSHLRRLRWQPAEALMSSVLPTLPRLPGSGDRQSRCGSLKWLLRPLNQPRKYLHALHKLLTSKVYGAWRMGSAVLLVDIVVDLPAAPTYTSRTSDS